MRDDHSGAAVALRRIAKAISSTDPEEKRRIRAYLVWVGRMFRDNEIVRAALVELRRRESYDDERFAQREQALLGPVTAALQRLALALATDGPLQEETLQAIQRETTATGRMRSP